MTDAAQALGRPAPTWRGLPVAWLPPLLRLDRIFVGPRVTVEAVHTGREFHGSDHCPLIATLRLS
jgi:endonuclease/exonuclease/phosphatase family metal-dependent hydrolase